MKSIKTTFAAAAFGSWASETFWLLIWAIFILDDARRREEERVKRRREPQPPPRPKPPAPPCP
jgi:hypothetical protein